MYKCSNCGYETVDKKDFERHLEDCHERGVSQRVGWGSYYDARWALAVLLALLALTARPVYAQPEPMPNAFTAVFFHDTNVNGALDANESMAAGIPLAFTETHVDGTGLSISTQSNSNGYFTTSMQPCPCTWVLESNGETWQGDVETWSGHVYQPVAIKAAHVVFLTMVMGEDGVTGDVQ